MESSIPTGDFVRFYKQTLFIFMVPYFTTTKPFVERDRTKCLCILILSIFVYSLFVLFKIILFCLHTLIFL